MASGRAGARRARVIAAWRWWWWWRRWAVSFRVTNDVRAHARCSPAARLVLLVMASYADHQGHCHPSVETLMRGTGLARRTVKYQLRALERLGELERISAGTGGRWKSTRYRIRVQQGGGAEERVQTVHPFAEEKGANGDRKGCKRRSERVHHMHPEGQGRREERESACSADAAPASLEGSPLEASKRNGRGRTVRQSERSPAEAVRPGAGGGGPPAGRCAAADLDVADLLAAPAAVEAVTARGWLAEQAIVVAGAWRAHHVAHGTTSRARDAWALSLAGWVRREQHPPDPPPEETLSARWRRERAEMRRLGEEEVERRRKGSAP